MDKHVIKKLKEMHGNNIDENVFCFIVSTISYIHDPWCHHITDFLSLGGEGQIEPNLC